MMVNILLLKESVEMVLAKPSLRINVATLAVLQWRKPSIVCLVTSLGGRCVLIFFFLISVL